PRRGRRGSRVETRASRGVLRRRPRAGIWIGRGERRLHRVVDALLDVALDRLELLLVHAMLRRDPCPQERDRVALAPALALALRPVGARVGLGMAEVAVGERLDERGALPCA